MNQENSSKTVIFYDFLTGTFETGLALALLVFGKPAFQQYQQQVLSGLLENSHYLLAGYIERLFPYFLEHTHYIAYLVGIVGVVKIISGIGMLYGKIWAADLLIIVTFIFLPFDVINILQEYTIYKLVYLVTHIIIIFMLTGLQPHNYIKHTYNKYKSS